MHELVRIIEAVEATDEPLYLATVVDVVGSAYRRPTARMLILPEGQHIGTISGGCLERDLCRAAAELTQQGPKLVSFDTRTDSTNFNPRYNVGCNGIIYVLVERVTRAQDCPMSLLRRVLQTETAHVAVTVYQSTIDRFHVGQRFVESSPGLPDMVSRELAGIQQQVHADGRPTCCHVTSVAGEMRMLIEKVAPPKPLWIFGAAEDAVPLAAMASQLGWNVTVADHRASLLCPERFPHARLVCQPWHELPGTLSATPETAAVLLTHSFDADRMLLPFLLAADISYVGVLGPKSRTAKVMRELHDAGKLPRLESLDRLHTPVGLDLGASTPSEIAVAIVGEIIALSHDRSGGRLGSRQAPIHDPVRYRLVEFEGAGMSNPNGIVDKRS